MSEDSTSQRVRLNKLIADSGLASRRHADKMIEEGMVTVNGKRVYELGVKVDPQHDKILVEGKVLRKPLSQKLYLIFNKPAGVLTTMDDPEGRPTIAEYLGDVPSRVFPVGRLDWDSEGMILLTNDGDYANKVAHPKEEVTKTYLVKLDGKPEPRHLQKLKDGVSIVGGKVSARHIEKIKKSGDNKSEKYEWYKIVITEGKNRQIRQMFAKIGFDVMRLQRVAIGRLRMGAMKAGELMFINDVAANRVFLADDPEDLKVKKNSYKGRAPAQKAAADSKKSAAEKEKAREKKMSAGKKKYAGGKLIAPKGPKRK
ncbi:MULTISPECIES: pseudouridine synthase [unclassified Bdellovibrio]|uniref:pseudouridine synthase n=1 Tax=unclassified Bdellovibrio TaxID=2633795 RepID=UPI001157BDD9|nr:MULTISPECIES: pseudouridine synthase [unclassified Bdellovibrio]QDK44189.1 rRNA pseudouridine synthase [Bdellovibrio sp. ZAP7]QLY26018.1 rRNA pseudouridine synthase [Bdellovibrio sp. KM01]